MFEFSGFDPSTMSDDDLLQKTTDLHAKIVWAGRFGSADMIGGLQRLLQAVEGERSQRIMNRFVQDRENALRDVIETDPDLAAADDSQPSPDRGKIVPQKRPRATIQISSRPTSD
jgi:hypothetical protein